MKKIFGIISVFIFLGVSSNSQVLRNDGELNVSAGYLVISGDYRNESAAELTIDGILSLSGDFTNNSSTTVITGSGTDGEVVFAGSTTQTIGGSASQTNFEKLTINSGATVDLTAGKYVTAQGATDISGTFNLLSASGGTASLISVGTVSGSGTTNAERYITYNTWHNVSSSVTGQSINTFLTTGANDIPTKDGGDTYGSEFYDEANGVWTYFTTSNAPGAGNFVPGYGYLVRRGTIDGVITFSGGLNAGAISPSVTTSRYGWNSLGNPYSSSIAFNSSAAATNFIDVNSAEFEDSYAGGYFWNGTDYTLINNASVSTYLAPGQGFLVNATSGSTAFDFTAAMQSHGNPTFYKKAVVEDFNRLLLYVTNENDSASTQILFRSDMTRGLDVTYDGGLFGGNKEFLLYTELIDKSSDVQFTIQCLPSQETDSMIVPIGFDCAEGGIVSFSAEITSLPTDYITVFEDRQLDVFTDLNIEGASYEVDLAPGASGFGRFFLHAVAMEPNAVLPESVNSMSIYTIRKEIIVKGFIDSNSSLSLFDMTGKKLAEYKLEEGKENRIQLDEGIQSGIYIAKVSGSLIDKTAKLFIK
ncbi:MAG: hypothetical protein WD577_05965 [Bacteroidales bacterium]